MKWKDKRELKRIRDYILERAEEKFVIKNITLNEHKLLRLYIEIKKYNLLSHDLVLGRLETVAKNTYYIRFYPGDWFGCEDKKGSVRFEF